MRCVFFLTKDVGRQSINNNVCFPKNLPPCSNHSKPFGTRVFRSKKKTTVVFFLMIGFDLVGLPWATRHLFDFDIKEVQSLFSDCKPARQNPFSPSEEVLGENKKNKTPQRRNRVACIVKRATNVYHTNNNT